LIGGSLSEDLNYFTAPLPVQMPKEDDNLDELPEINTMVFFDSVRTNEFDKKDGNAFNKAVFKMNMPEYAHHAACCLYWKKYIYVVGGELDGKWTSKAHRLDLDTFEFT
jgi:hypothetical protein